MPAGPSQPMVAKRLITEPTGWPRCGSGVNVTCVTVPRYQSGGDVARHIPCTATAWRRDALCLATRPYEKRRCPDRCNLARADRCLRSLVVEQRQWRRRSKQQRFRQRLRVGHQRSRRARRLRHAEEDLWPRQRDRRLRSRHHQHVDSHRHHGRPGRRCCPWPGARILRHRRRFQQVVQRGRRHQRPQDHR